MNMPIYAFKCDNCNIVNEFKLSLSEHNTLKNNIHCTNCNNKMYQLVSNLNFTLKGEGWFGKSSDAIEHPYAITQRELNRNLDLEKKVEDVANNHNVKEN